MLWSIRTCELAPTPFFFLEWEGFGLRINYANGKGVDRESYRLISPLYIPTCNIISTLSNYPGPEYYGFYVGI